MRPVSDEFEVTQAFGSYATAGVVADWNGTDVQQLVAAYGNYQPFGHAGCDIGCPVGTPVHAIAGGTVLWADWGTNLPGDESDWGYRQRWYLYKTFPGVVTVIQHDGWIGVYAHLSEAWLNPGDTVTEGQVIGKSGNTRAPGQTLGAHLHVEALIDLSYSTGNGLIYGRTDPTPFFGSGTISAQGDIITEGFLMALTDDEQRRLLQAADRINGVITDPDAKVLTTNDLPAIGKAVAETEVAWYGFDGKVPADGRQTTTPKIQLGWADTQVAALSAAVAGLTELVKQLSLKQGVTIDYDAIAKAVNDDAAKRLAG